MSILVTGLVWKNSRHDGSALLLLLAIADYADDHGVAFPSIPALRRKARLSKSTVFRTLEVLKGSGELEIVEAGGGRRTTRYRVIPPAAEQLAILPAHSPRHPPRQGSQFGTGPKRGPQGSLFGTGAVPESGPVVRQLTVIEPSATRASARDALRSIEKAPTTKQLDREKHLFGDEAEKVWEKTARERGNPYVDRAALRRVHQQAIEATLWASETQVLAAIMRRLDHESSPVRIPEWARLESADVSEAEHNARKAAEKAERNTVVEHQGVRWLGHVPNLGPEGRCVVKGCGRTPDDHRLAEPKGLRHIGSFMH
jgi:hypothetical protein